MTAAVEAVLEPYRSRELADRLDGSLRVRVTTTAVPHPTRWRDRPASLSGLPGDCLRGRGLCRIAAAMVGFPARGRDEIEHAGRRAAADYREGRAVGFENLATYMSGDLGYHRHADPITTLRPGESVIQA